MRYGRVVMTRVNSNDGKGSLPRIRVGIPKGLGLIKNC